MSEFAGQNIAVIGLAATGLATANVLRGLGATITVYDSKPEAQLDPVRVAEVRTLVRSHTMDGVTFRPATDIVDTNTDLVVPSPGVPRYARVLTDAMERGLKILGEIEVAYRLAKAPILAITGTNGKTTTTALVGAICREAGLKTWVAGNIAEDAGVRLPLIQAAMEAPQDGVIVAEISSFQLEWVERFRPKVAAWLNLSPDHLDRHKDMDEYARAKSNIFRAQTEDDYAVLNADDERVMRYGAEVGQAKRLTFSLNDPGERDEIKPLRPDAFPRQHGSNRQLLAAPGFGPRIGIEESRLQIIGSHNIANVLAAILMAAAFNIPPEAIQQAVYAFRGVAHRMEFVAEINGVRYINNSMCTNPAALVASVSAIGTPLIAISGGIHKGGDLSEVGQALAKHTKHTVLIGKSAGEFADAMKNAGSAAYTFTDTLPDAVEQAYQMAQPGDTVMLVPGCASFDMFSGFEERGQVFRDAVQARTQWAVGNRPIENLTLQAEHEVGS